MLRAGASSPATSRAAPWGLGADADAGPGLEDGAGAGDAITLLSPATKGMHADQRAGGRGRGSPLNMNGRIDNSKFYIPFVYTLTEQHKSSRSKFTKALYIVFTELRACYCSN